MTDTVVPHEHGNSGACASRPYKSGTSTRHHNHIHVLVRIGFDTSEQLHPTAAKSWQHRRQGTYLDVFDLQPARSLVQQAVHVMLCDTARLAQRHARPDALAAAAAAL